MKKRSNQRALNMLHAGADQLVFRGQKGRGRRVMDGSPVAAELGPLLCMLTTSARIHLLSGNNT